MLSQVTGCGRRLAVPQGSPRFSLHGQHAPPSTLNPCFRKPTATGSSSIGTQERLNAPPNGSPSPPRSSPLIGTCIWLQLTRTCLPGSPDLPSSHAALTLRMQIHAAARTMGYDMHGWNWASPCCHARSYATAAAYDPYKHVPILMCAVPCMLCANARCHNRE